MSDPSVRHAEALAALDRRVEDTRKLIVASRRVQLALKGPRLLGRYIPGWHSWQDVEALLTAGLDGLRGQRAIAQRHAPRRVEYSAEDQSLENLPPVEWRCRGCGARWEDCPDWVDVAAGLEVGDATP